MNSIAPPCLCASVLYVVLSSVLSLAGCDRSGQKQVVLYTSVDEPIVRSVIEEFKRTTGIQVVVRTDTEASKTAALVQTLRAEKANPRADVFWNNEIFHTIVLAEEGVLSPYDSPIAKGIPARFRDPSSRWSANGLRVRTIARAPSAGDVNCVEDLLRPELRGKICMGNPALGTISGQVAAWFVERGPQGAEKFLRDLKSNGLVLLGGNSEVVRQVASGQMLVGLTDNDDIDAMKAEGGKLSGVPAKSRMSGALAIPCSVALVAGAKHPQEAKRVIDYLLSPQVERKMIHAGYAALSVRSTDAAAMRDIALADYPAIASAMPAAVDLARKILEGRE